MVRAGDAAAALGVMAVNTKPRLGCAVLRSLAPSSLARSARLRRARQTITTPPVMPSAPTMRLMLIMATVATGQEPEPLLLDAATQRSWIVVALTPVQQFVVVQVHSHEELLGALLGWGEASTATLVLREAVGEEDDAGVAPVERLLEIVAVILCATDEELVVDAEIAGTTLEAADLVRVTVTVRLRVVDRLTLSAASCDFENEGVFDGVRVVPNDGVVVRVHDRVPVTVGEAVVVAKATWPQLSIINITTN